MPRFFPVKGPETPLKRKKLRMLAIPTTRFSQRWEMRMQLSMLGIFAVDSPTRPNLIGLTLVCFIKREGNRLFVQGLDFFDGTPILDIKGYGPGYRTENYALPQWYERLMDEKGRV